MVPVGFCCEFLEINKKVCMKFVTNIAAAVALTCALSTLSAGQTAGEVDNPAQAAQQDAAGSASPQTDNKKQENAKTAADANGKVAGTSNDRLFYALPNFLSLQGQGHLPPLTAKDKFKVVALGTFDYVEYPWWGILAAINQAENSEPGFGQGWASYGKRYGTTMGDSMVENFMTGAVFPSMLHQDPRFYQSDRGGFWRKSEYAITRIFVTRSDSGHAQFNYSEILGSATAAAISTYSYHPRSTYLSTPTNPHLFIPSDRTLSNATSVWGTQLTLDTITIVVKEFWPDIHRKLSHKPNPDIQGHSK
jgi:hypothetical protein